MKQLQVRPGQKVRLSSYDPEDTTLAPGGKEKTNDKSDRLVERLGELQELLYAGGRRKVLVILQGMDTSGKDGTIRHVMRGVSPQSVRAVAFKQPSPAELAHDFLWRVHAQVPGAGEIAIFNRSHYEDVLVVRVHGLVPATVWKRRYRQINDFERMLTESGTLVLKFFLHISEEEQRRRLQARLDDPSKRWKFQAGDLRERKRWKDYQTAYEDALSKTSTKQAPWTIVPANKKWFRNYVVAKVIVDALEKLDMKYPRPDLSGVSIGT